MSDLPVSPPDAESSAKPVIKTSEGNLMKVHVCPVCGAEFQSNR